MSRRMITYPTNRLIGVLDDPAAASGVAADLEAAGFPRAGIDVLSGQDGLERMSRLGPRPNLLSRTVRAFQFMSMDQTPDFLVYERALLDGRAVVAVGVAPRDRMLAAAAILERHGAHFLNHFGRLWTEEVSLWRGAEPEIPDALRR